MSVKMESSSMVDPRNLHFDSLLPALPGGDSDANGLWPTAGKRLPDPAAPPLKTINGSLCPSELNLKFWACNMLSLIRLSF